MQIELLCCEYFTNEKRRKIHNSGLTRSLMLELYDAQVPLVSDFDCFSLALFRRFEDYKRMKQDFWYQEHLIGDHEDYDDTKRGK